MSTFKEIAGRNIRSYTTNPDNPLEGQMWYNQTDLALKGVVASGAWSSGGTANVVAYNLGGAGTNTAALTMGGANSTGTGSLTSTEEYNGSTWTAVTGLPGGVSYTGGCGTQTAALLAGGANIPAYASTNSYEYDGSSWTGGGTMNTATGSAGQVIGIQTAALISGGDRVPGAPRTIANAEEYDGSAWTSVTSLPAVRQYQGTAGIQTAGVLWGGYADTNPGTPNVPYTTTLEYDGSTWTAGGDIPGTRNSSGGSGTQTDALAFAGNPGSPSLLNTTLNYDGTAWAANPASLASGRQHMASSSSGPSTAAFAAKGSLPTVTATMEVYNFLATVTTPATWASGGNLGTGRNGAGGCGPQTAAMAYGGQQNPGTATKGETEQYDGTSWSEVNDLNTARYTGAPSGQGTQTATLVAGGQRQSPDVNFYNNTETWDGTSWSEQNNLNTGRDQIAGAGTSGAALAFGGDTPPITAFTESWDGTSWSEVNDLNSADRLYYGTGSQTAAIAIGGKTTPNAKTEEWDGTNWTAGGSLNSGRASGGIAGSQTATVYFGGDTPTPYPSATELYDGTSWSTSPASLATGRQRLTQGSGSQTAALGSGGYTPVTAASTATEEFTGEIVSANIKTFTTS